MLDSAVSDAPATNTQATAKNILENLSKGDGKNLDPELIALLQNPEFAEGFLKFVESQPDKLPVQDADTKQTKDSK